MVNTTQIRPALILQPFISCYALRVFNTGNWAMPQPMHAVHEYFMTFFLKDQFCDFIDDSGKNQVKNSNSLTTFFTQSHGCNYWKGDYAIFCVQFKANGLFAIFGIPQNLLIDTVLCLDTILLNDSKLLTEQFTLCKDIFEMGKYMDEYLTKKFILQKHKVHTEIIAKCSDIILKNKGNVSLDELAYYTNMSFRNFERRFTEEVGMPPKLYSRITRFYNALENKMLHPAKSWTNISHESGYFDQAHFIREVKMFSNKTPDELFKSTPPPTEKFIEKVEY